MKKEILSALTFTVLLTGCQQTNQPQISDEAKIQMQEKNTNILPKNAIDMKEELTSFYKEWKGTKYKSGGNTKKGIDSSALTQRAFKEKFFTDIPRTASKQAKIGIKVKKANLVLGDIIIFKRKGILFTGIYMEKNEFMHSSYQGVKIDRLDKAPYTYRYYTARRVF